MGATFYFDQMLPPPPAYTGERSRDEWHQIEVFTHGGRVFL